MLTYPSGRKVKTCYDSVARIQSVANGTSGAAYPTVDAVSGYSAHEAIRQKTLGNGVVETTKFDSLDGVTQLNTHLQPTHHTAVKGSTTLLSLQNGYCPSALTGCTTNNGNLQSQVITRGSNSWAQTYGCGNLDWLTSAGESGTGSWTSAGLSRHR